jgi:hypothetical protein
MAELQKTDESLTSRLKQIVHSYGWPTIALVGIQASQAAVLILVHSPDHDFQQRLLPELQKLVEEKKIVGSDIAVLADKILVAKGKPQRFGTQFSWRNNGPMVMNPVEDPGHLDQRRELYFIASHGSVQMRNGSYVSPENPVILAKPAVTLAGAYASGFRATGICG